ncbi:MAG: Glyoxylate/hydroxypyruvate reductase A [Alphaproteobacteria bacterium MarineAlpha11_Bin1]|nr:MAG: Glyoxylate/hydroxypyruvate reductase A [Alphaproteobacteria bacterium MarineAlpha11_Bin1]|tara:strand:+ start:1770 stop:2702 length:933 start_codon:yes stop_codon:yes gene_type:complete
MALLFMCNGEDPDIWMDALREEMSELDIRCWPDQVGDFADIDVVLTWEAPPGVLAMFPNLKAILSLGAGLEHLLSDPELPRGVPIARLIDPGLKTGMTEFVTMEILRHHRREAEYRAQQRAGKWKLLRQTMSRDRRIGILGLGHLGSACGEILIELGFPVCGWSRTYKKIPNIESFIGEDGLFSVLERSDILVCLLPLTPQTEDILDATTLGALPRGAFLINAARGKHVVDDDLIDALDSGQLSGATLDVYREEPLGRGHPFWTHPKIVMYPHAAAWTLPESAAPVIADNIRRARNGKVLNGQLDTMKGY